MKNKKDYLRKKFNLIRKKKYFEINKSFFNPFFSLLKKKLKKNKINLSFYYPSNYEVNTLKIFENNNVNDMQVLLPSITNKSLKFYKWINKDPLLVNKYGMLEPSTSSKSILPDIVLAPLLAYDLNKYRLGYGKGYYVQFLSKYLKLNKNILTVGVAFSFQKYKKLPTSNYDVKLDYILTEKGIY